MTRRVLPILALLILCPFYASAQDCERETDEFKGTDKITCEGKSITITDQPGEQIFEASLMAAMISDHSALIVAITTFSDSWNFLDTDTAYILADGTRIEVPAKRTGNRDVRDGGTVAEQQALMLDQQQARQISQADTVRMKMGTAVFRLDPLPAQLGEIFRLMD